MRLFVRAMVRGFALTVAMDSLPVGSVLATCWNGNITPWDRYVYLLERCLALPVRFAKYLPCDGLGCLLM